MRTKFGYIYLKIFFIIEFQTHGNLITIILYFIRFKQFKDIKIYFNQLLVAFINKSELFCVFLKKKIYIYTFYASPLKRKIYATILLNLKQAICVLSKLLLHAVLLLIVKIPKDGKPLFFCFATFICTIDSKIFRVLDIAHVKKFILNAVLRNKYFPSQNLLALYCL